MDKKKRLEDSIRNQIASLQAEGYEFDESDKILITHILDSESNIDDIIKNILKKYSKNT